MTRPLRSYPEKIRKEVIKRRLKEKALGLGYISALIASRIYNIREEKEEKNG